MTIKLNNLTITYGKFEVLKNVTLEVQSEVLSVEGKNGSGKSTLLKVLGGSLNPKEGQILVDEQQLNYRNFAKRNVSVCPDVDELPDLLTATQYLKIVSKLRLVDNLDFVSQIANLIDFDLAGRKPISDFSRGMRQKLCVLATFVGNRRMLVFDESFASMDQESRKQLLKQLPSVIDDSPIETVVMVNHNPDFQYVESSLRRILCDDSRLVEISN